MPRFFPDITTPESKHWFLTFFVVIASTHCLSDLAYANPTDAFPNEDLIVKWSDSSDLKSENLDVISKVNITCEDKFMYPTHPQQQTKSYHSHIIGTYKKSLLTGEDKACRVATRPSKKTDSKRCIEADRPHIVILSDLYRDSCGGLYRAYWRVSYLKSQENMSTLVAKGRTLKKKKNSQFKDDLEIGDTFKVPQEEFLFFSKPSEADISSMEKSISAAARTHNFDQTLGIFEAKAKTSSKLKP